MMKVNLEEMVFDSVDLVQVPVKVEGQWYILEEAGSAAAVEFEDHKHNTIKFDTDENGKFKSCGVPQDLEQAKLRLLSRSLFKADKLNDGTFKKCHLTADGKGIPVGNLVNSWPMRVTTPMCERLLQISELSTVLVEGKEQPNPTQSDEQKSTNVS